MATDPPSKLDKALADLLANDGEDAEVLNSGELIIDDLISELKPPPVPPTPPKRPTPPLVPLLELPPPLAPAARAAASSEPAAPPATAATAQAKLPEHSPEALIRTCESEITRNPPRSRAAKLHCEIALVYEDLLGDMSRARSHYEQALVALPDCLPALQGARRIALALEDYDRVLALLELEAELRAEPAVKAMLHYQRARLFEDFLGNRGRARQAYQAAFELAPTNLSILKALERLALKDGRVDEMAELYARAANAVTDDPALRAVLIVRRAALVEARNPKEAADLYESALSADPMVLGAIDALERLYHASKRWGSLADTLRRKAALHRDAHERALALYHLGRVQAERLGNRTDAIASLRAAAEATAYRERFILDDLARLYSEGNDYPALASVIEALILLAVDRREKVALLYRLGAIRQSHLNDGDSAIVSYKAALALDPTHVPALQALGKLLADRVQWLDVIDMHRAEVEATMDTKRQAAALTRIAEVYEIYLGRPKDAMEQYARALSLVPGHAAAFKALDRLYTHAGKFRELVDMYELAIELSSDVPRKLAYLAKIGSLWEERLGDPVQAIFAYRRMLDLEPKNMRALFALQRACEQAGRYEELALALQSEAELTRDKAHAIDLWYRAGVIADEHLSDWQGAASRFLTVLDLEPHYLPALVALGALYHRAGRWNELIQIYQRQLAITASTGDRVVLLYKMGELCEQHLGRQDRALEYYRQAVDADPSYQAALHALSRQLRERGAYSELTQVYERMLGGIEDPRERAQFLFYTGQLYEEHLEDLVQAAACYERAIVEVNNYRPALTALARLHSQTGAWNHLVQELGHLGTLTSDPRSTAATLLWRSEVARERLGDPAQALGYLQALLDHPEGRLPGLLALESLYIAGDSWDELADVYAKEAELIHDVGARVAVLREFARVQETRSLGSAGELAVSYEAIASAAGEDETALHALQQLSRKRGDRQTLAQLCRRLGQSVQAPELGARYLTSWGHLVESSEPAEALQAYKQALERDGESLAALRGIARTAEALGDFVTLAEAHRREADAVRGPQAAASALVRSATTRLGITGDTAGAIADLERAIELWPDGDQAVRALIPPLVQGGKIEHLVDVLSRAASSAKLPSRAAEYWVEVGQLYADHLNNIPGAIAAFRRALRSVPVHPGAQQKLAATYVRDGRWSDAISAYEQILQGSGNPQGMCDAYIALAEILSRQFGDTLRAKEHLKSALKLQPEHPRVLAMLSELQVADGEGEAAVEMARRLVSVTQDDKARIEALRHLATVEQKRGEIRAAEHALANALVLEGPGGNVAEHFKRLVSEGGQWVSYAGALIAFIDQGDHNRAAMIQAYIELSRTHGDAMGLHREAVINLERGMEELENPPELILELIPRLRQAGRLQEAAAYLRELLEKDAARAELWRELADILDNLKRPDEALLARAPLVLLKAANSEETALVRARGRAKELIPGSFTPEDLDAIAVDRATSLSAARLLGAIAESLGKLYPPDFDRLSLSRRDRIGPRSRHPVRVLADQVAAVFGVEYDLYVHGASEPQIAVEMAEPPAIIVAESIANRSEAEQLFLIGYTMTQIAGRFYPIEQLSSKELGLALAGATRAVVEDYAPAGYDEEELEDIGQRIKKAISRKSRRALEAAALEYSTAPSMDMDAWQAALQQSAMRAALIIADDLFAAVEVLRGVEDLGKVHGPELLRSSDVIADLVRFWAAPTAISLRRRIGLMA